MNKEPRQIEVVVDFVDRVHGTGFPEIRPWRPQLAIPVEFVDVVAGTDGYLPVHPRGAWDSSRSGDRAGLHSRLPG